MNWTSTGAWVFFLVIIRYINQISNFLSLYSRNFVIKKNINCLRSYNSEPNFKLQTWFSFWTSPSFKQKACRMRFKVFELSCSLSISVLSEFINNCMTTLFVEQSRLNLFLLHIHLRKTSHIAIQFKPWIKVFFASKLYLFCKRLSDFAWTYCTHLWLAEAWKTVRSEENVVYFFLILFFWANVFYKHSNYTDF